MVASSNGSYAVEITKNNCVDTSQCVAILNVGLKNIQTSNWVKAYPNPTSQNLTIETASVQGNNASYTLQDVMGKEIKSGQLFGNKTILPLNVAEGLYYLRIRNNRDSQVIKVMKN